MAAKNEPILFLTNENPGYLNNLAKDIDFKVGEESSYLLDYPIIYIHIWQNKYDKLANRYSIYVGESNDVVQRTKEHWSAANIPAENRDPGNWQYHMVEDLDENGKHVVPQMYVIGHHSFNKSLTLDIENRLIDYCLAMPTANPKNGRGNPQRDYNTHDELDNIYSKIWRKLRKSNSDLFLPESEIKKSALYRSSPNHVLTPDQNDIKQKIIKRLIDIRLNAKSNMLIFVEGEAGTGKTVLTNAIFYEILDTVFFGVFKFNAFLLINHNEQLNLCTKMANRLGYRNAEEPVVQNPTHFLKTHSILSEDGETYLPDPDNIADVVFVDEAHLLWDQSNQAFNKKFKDPQLDEIMKRAMVTIIMYDENQIVHKGQFQQHDYMMKKRQLAQSQLIGDVSNYFVLKNQLRMNCSQETMQWIDKFSKELTIDKLHLNSNGLDSKEYEIKFFDSPKKLHEEITKKATLNPEDVLSRIIATYDWEYILGKDSEDDDKMWSVKIGNWKLPWNEEIFHKQLENNISSRMKKRYSELDWAEKDYTINEVGSTFTIQGFDLSYAGVILGPSVRYDKNTKKVWFDESLRAWDQMKGKRKLRDGTTVNVTKTISMHELRILLTRGTKGLYIYACDKDLREALKNCVGKKDN